MGTGLAAAAQPVILLHLLPVKVLLVAGKGPECWWGDRTISRSPQFCKREAHRMSAALKTIGRALPLSPLFPPVVGAARSHWVPIKYRMCFGLDVA